MSSETLASEKDPQPINWNAMLWNSFLFAQGDDLAHAEIMNWLAAGPLKGTHPKKEDFNLSMIARQAGNPEAHVWTEGAESVASGNADWMIDMINDPTKPYLLEIKYDLRGGTRVYPREELRHPVESMLEKDEWYFKPKEYGSTDERLIQQGRPKKLEKAGRDIWSSFIIDFALLKKGTPPYSYTTLPDAYKQMLESVTGELRQEKYKERLRKIAELYFEKHPDLPEEEKRAIEAFF
ncbi:MAG: hypothetical protein AAB440_02535 [Patescibacteria group bacterium]